MRYNKTFVRKNLKNFNVFVFIALVALLVILIAGVFWSVKNPVFKNNKTDSYQQKNTEQESSFKPTSLDPDIYHIPLSPYLNGLSLVFFADGYLSWDDFEKDTDAIARGLKLVEPWKSYDKYNIYKIRPKELDICVVRTENERKPVLRCDTRKTNEYLNKITIPQKPFKLIVLSRRDFQSWANVVRLNDTGIFFSITKPISGLTEEQNYAILFLHLIGHAFGLKDEEKFVIAKAESAVHIPDGPNCAPDKKTAQKWWGRLAENNPSVGYFKGCSGSDNYIKPTEYSLMNLGEFSFSDIDYGPVSEEYLRKILEYCYSDRNYKKQDDPDFFERYPEFSSCVGD